MALIHILDKQSDKIIGTLNLGEYTDDEKVTSSENKNAFDFTALKKFDLLQKRNRLLLQDKDGFFSEFLIVYAEQNSRNQKFIQSNATFTDLQKAKIIEPQTLQGATADTATTKALEGTEWRKGKVDYNGIRTLKIEEYTNPYNLLKIIASEFGLDLRFRVAVEGNKIVRYVDLTLPDDEFDGKEVVFGKDLIGLRRIEDAQNIVTALLVLGPEQEDGKRLTVLVEDNDALQRWGRNGQHLIEVYEPQISAEEVAIERLRALGQNALQKRIDAIVTYECQAAILEHIPGKEHEKVRLDRTIRIKDEGYTPPLYLEAKVLEVKEQPSTGKILDFKLGNYKEYSKADLEAQIAGLKKQLNDKLSKLVQVSVTSSAGTVFKNGTGETDLTAVTFLGGKEVDTGGTLYSYTWAKYDKNGNFVGATSGKSITVYARNIDEKETYIVTVENEGAKSIGQITVTNVNDGEQGPKGPKGDDGKTTYTWRKYADDANGTNMSDNPEGKQYLGMAFNKETPIASMNPQDYSWSAMYDTEKLEETKEIANNAVDVANKAKEDAQNAQTTADGKNTVFYQATAPSTIGRKINDLWYDTDDGYKPYRFDGSDWIPAPFGNAAIANLDVGKIVGDQGNFNWLEAKHIKSLNGLNVGNGQFVVDENGNVKFAGNLEGASGTFGQVTVKDGDFYLEDTNSSTKYSIVQKSNLIEDHSFELVWTQDEQEDSATYFWFKMHDTWASNSSWRAVGTPMVGMSGMHGPAPINARPIFGDKAIIVNSANYVYQNLWNTAGNTTYTLSAFAKRAYNLAQGALRIEVYRVSTDIYGNTTETLLKAQNFSTVASDYKAARYSMTFTTPTMSQSDELKVVIKGTNTNWVHVDGVQLVENSSPVVYADESTTWDIINGRFGIQTWTDFAGLNGWRNYGAEYTNARYRQLSTREVVVTGMLKDGAVGVGMVRLPQSMWPIRRMVFSCMSSVGAVRVDVMPDGYIACMQNYGGWVSIDGIRFFPDA